ncbi:MAG: G1 family endopeptidase [Chloroflexota bacterium]|nr:G1 family endopeptidase [Chloroflexota bacterium]
MKLVRGEFKFDHRFRRRRAGSSSSDRNIAYSGGNPLAAASSRMNAESPDRRVITRRGRESSFNWSGAYITPSDGRMFTEVHGWWRVPRVSRPPGAPVNAAFDCSVWIGLDGQRRYYDASLPQIGTSHYLACGESEARTSVWWQWWLRGAKNLPPVTVPLKVNPGDEVMCSIFVVSPTRVRFIVKNNCTGELCTPFETDEPTSYLDLQESGPRVPVLVSGATAEWIVERPTIWPTETQEPFPCYYELPDYGTVEFGDCFAVSAPEPRDLYAHVRRGEEERVREESLEGARLINMYTVKQDPPLTVIVSEAQRNGDHGVRTSYRT